MVRSFVRLAAATFLCALLGACASGPDRSDYSGAGRTVPDSPLQCVPYAREQAQIPIYGDAYTWWDKAEGRYARSTVPSQGAVMVLHNYAGPNRAHVAVVREMISAREIRVDHANWLDDGAIFVDDPVKDVSPDNDWSQVRVFNIRAGAWGGRTYDVKGFIGPGPESNAVYLAQNPVVRSADPIAGLLADDLADGDDDLR
jgi:surface antigen